MVKVATAKQTQTMLRDCRRGGYTVEKKGPTYTVTNPDNGDKVVRALKFSWGYSLILMPEYFPHIND